MNLGSLVDPFNRYLGLASFWSCRLISLDLLLQIFLCLSNLFSRIFDLPLNKVNLLKLFQLCSTFLLIFWLLLALSLNDLSGFTRCDRGHYELGLLRCKLRLCQVIVYWWSACLKGVLIFISRSFAFDSAFFAATQHWQTLSDRSVTRVTLGSLVADCQVSDWTRSRLDLAARFDWGSGSWRLDS